MSMSNYMETIVDKAAKQRFVGETINGIEINDASAEMVDGGEFDIYISGKCEKELEYIIKELDVLKEVKSEINDFIGKGVSGNDLNIFVNTLWKKIEDMKDEITGAIQDEMYENIMDMNRDFYSNMSKEYFGAEIGGFLVLDTNVNDASNSFYGSVSYTIYPDGVSVDVKNFDKETLKNYIENA